MDSRVAARLPRQVALVGGTMKAAMAYAATHSDEEMQEETRKEASKIGVC